MARQTSAYHQKQALLRKRLQEAREGLQEATLYPTQAVDTSSLPPNELSFPESVKAQALALGVEARWEELEDGTLHIHFVFPGKWVLRKLEPGAPNSDGKTRLLSEEGYKRIDTLFNLIEAIGQTPPNCEKAVSNLLVSSDIICGTGEDYPWPYPNLHHSRFASTEHGLDHAAEMIIESLAISYASYDRLTRGQETLYPPCISALEEVALSVVSNSFSELNDWDCSRVPLLHRISEKPFEGTDVIVKNDGVYFALDDAEAKIPRIEKYARSLNGGVYLPYTAIFFEKVMPIDRSSRLMLAVESVEPVLIKLFESVGATIVGARHFLFNGSDLVPFLEKARDRFLGELPKIIDPLLSPAVDGHTPVRSNSFFCTTDLYRKGTQPVLIDTPDLFIHFIFSFNEQQQISVCLGNGNKGNDVDRAITPEEYLGRLEGLFGQAKTAELCKSFFHDRILAPEIVTEAREKPEQSNLYIAAVEASVPVYFYTSFNKDSGRLILACTTDSGKAGRLHLGPGALKKLLLQQKFSEGTPEEMAQIEFSAQMDAYNEQVNQAFEAATTEHAIKIERRTHEELRKKVNTLFDAAVAGARTIKINEINETYDALVTTVIERNQAIATDAEREAFRAFEQYVRSELTSLETPWTVAIREQLTVIQQGEVRHAATDPWISEKIVEPGKQQLVEKAVADVFSEHTKLSTLIDNIPSFIEPGTGFSPREIVVVSLLRSLAAIEKKNPALVDTEIQYSTLLANVLQSKSPLKIGSQTAALLLETTPKDREKRWAALEVAVGLLVSGDDPSQSSGKSKIKQIFPDSALRQHFEKLRQSMKKSGVRAGDFEATPAMDEIKAFLELEVMCAAISGTVGDRLLGLSSTNEGEGAFIASKEASLRSTQDRWIENKTSEILGEKQLEDILQINRDRQGALSAVGKDDPTFGISRDKIVVPDDEQSKIREAVELELAKEVPTREKIEAQFIHLKPQYDRILAELRKEYGEAGFQKPKPQLAGKLQNKKQRRR